MDQHAERTGARIALDIERDRNRELLTEQFSAYDVVEFSGTVPRQVDLCVIDEPALERSTERFGSWRSEESPVFAPVALLSETDATNPWREFDGELSQYVDSVLRIPMPKAQLTARLENLLQMREFSRELDEEQQLTNLIFESSPLAKLVLEPDGTVVRANTRAGELVDEDPSDLVGQQYDSGDWTPVREDGTVIPLADRPFERVLATGQPVFGDKHLLERPDRDDIWVSVNMAPIRNESGRVEYVVAAIEDVTVQETQARELERQVDLFQKAQDIANVGAWEFDFQTEELYVTDEVARLYGVSADETVTPERALEAFRPADRDAFEEQFQRAVAADERCDLEMRMTTQDGAHRWVRVRGEPQYVDGDVARVRGTIQDITERKQREVELQQMKDAVDRAPIGITLADATQSDNPLTYVNDGFVALTGYPREEALGRNCRFLQGDGTDEQTVAKLRRSIDAEEPVSVTIRNYRANGSGYWNRVEIAPIRDEDGTVVEYIGFQQDVTDLVERQQQLQTLDRYLRHNMRNKMTVVNGQAELIRHEGESPITEYAETIEETGEKLLANVETERKITDQLRTEPEPTAVELMSSLRSIADSYGQEYPESTVSLSGPDSVAVRAVPDLPAAFDELVGNAVDHHESATPNVDITVERGDSTVSVTITDDGPRIPEAEVDMLVDPNASTPIKHAQGLGLWYVYLLVNHSDGRIQFEERPAGGNAITVELPAAADAL
jgi:PAS domain S-box-containing protein